MTVAVSGQAAVIDMVMGCNSCGTRWSGGELACWCCERPGFPVTKPIIGYVAGHPLGMWDEINRARKNGPTLSDDPSGGGPL